MVSKSGTSPPQVTPAASYLANPQRPSAQLLQLMVLASGDRYDGRRSTGLRASRQPNGVPESGGPSSDRLSQHSVAPVSIGSAHSIILHVPRHTLRSRLRHPESLRRLRGALTADERASAAGVRGKSESLEDTEGEADSCLLQISLDVGAHEGAVGTVEKRGIEGVL